MCVIPSFVRYIKQFPILYIMDALGIGAKKNLVLVLVLISSHAIVA